MANLVIQRYIGFMEEFWSNTLSEKKDKWSDVIEKQVCDRACERIMRRQT